MGDVEGTFFCPVLLGRQPELQPFMSLLHVRGRVRLAVSGRAAVKVTFNLSDGVFPTASPPPPPCSPWSRLFGVINSRLLRNR